MDFFKTKIAYAVVSVLVSLSLVAYSYDFYSVQAADISTLPVDIDCTMEYDSDYVYFTVDGRTTTIDRHMKVYDADSIPYRFDSYADFKASADSMGLDNVVGYIDYSSNGSVGFAVKDSGGAWAYSFADSLPLSIEEYRAGVPSPTSYWYSPSQDKIYVLTGDVYNSYSRAVKSYALGSFLFTTSNKSCDLYVTCIDCLTGSVVYKLDRLSGCDFYSYSYAWSERSGYPEDLLCFFANYEISGFYEPDVSKVVTPSYYFNYQYIFYRDGKGYTFIDSGLPLTEITAQSSYSYLTFEGSCNKYIYTSVDGISWTIRTSLSNMYGGTFTQLAYDWLYDKVTVGAVNEYSAELVYTNDDKFGKPMITPEFGDLSDITSNLNSIVNDKPLAGRLLGALADDISLFNLFNLLAYGIVGDGFDYWIDESDPSDHGHFGPRGEADASASYVVTYPSLASYLYNLVSSVENSNVILSAFRTDMHSDLKSVFDNITLSNTYLSGINKKLGELSIPDYKELLSDISAKLDRLPASGSFSAAPFDDTAILGRFDITNDYLKDIKGLETGNLLTNILNILTGTDGEGMKVTINPNFKLNIDNDLKASFSAKIDKLFDEIFKINASLDKIAEFNFGSGSGSDKDYSSQLTLINDNLYTASGRLYDANLSLDKLLAAVENLDFSVEFPSEPKNDLFYDDPDSDEDLIDFVSEYAQTALDKSYFSSFLVFDDDTMSGIRFYNSLSEDMFKALGPLGAAILVSVGFTLVGAAVRRHT